MGRNSRRQSAHQKSEHQQTYENVIPRETWQVFRYFLDFLVVFFVILFGATFLLFVERPCKTCKMHRNKNRTVNITQGAENGIFVETPPPM